MSDGKDAQKAGRATTGPKAVRSGRGASTRALLTSVALDMMAEGGEETVSLVDVAQRAGVTRGTVYHHFRKRQDLIKAAAISLEQTMEAIAFGTWGDDDPYGHVAELAARDPAVFRSHLRLMLRDGAAATPASRANIERFRAFAAEGRLQPDVDPFVGAMLAVSTELAALLVMQSARSPQEADDLIGRFSITLHRLFFHGILNPDSPGWPKPHSGVTDSTDGSGAGG
jgi:AcrR family transcriptional regulator